MANQTICDNCGRPGHMKFEMREPHDSFVDWREFCSAACLSSFVTEIEPVIDRRDAPMWEAIARIFGRRER